MIREDAVFASLTDPVLRQSVENALLLDRRIKKAGVVDLDKGTASIIRQRIQEVKAVLL